MNIRQDTGLDRMAHPTAWQDCEADMRVAQKTRRAVRDEVISTAERRKSQRRNLGIAMFAFALLLVLLAPAIWTVWKTCSPASTFSICRPSWRFRH